MFSNICQSRATITDDKTTENRICDAHEDEQAYRQGVDCGHDWMAVFLGDGVITGNTNSLSHDSLLSRAFSLRLFLDTDNCLRVLQLHLNRHI